MTRRIRYVANKDLDLDKYTLEQLEELAKRITNPYRFFHKKPYSEYTEIERKFAQMCKEMRRGIYYERKKRREQRKGGDKRK
jgi:hypothetical protein